MSEAGHRRTNRDLSRSLAIQTRGNRPRPRKAPAAANRAAAGEHGSKNLQIHIQRVLDVVLKTLR
jgi:hypothetical protein